jgi:hypothetical protein
LKKILLIALALYIGLISKGQSLVYTFIDPCTKQVSVFTVPANGTVIFFLNKSKSFTRDDLANGNLATWVNQVYADYRKVSPCSVQSGQVTQNQITSQVVSGAVQSVVSSVIGTASSSAVSSVTSTAVSSVSSSATASVSSSAAAGASTAGTSTTTSTSSSGGSSQQGEEVAASTTSSQDASNDQKTESGGSGGGGKSSKGGGGGKSKSSGSNPMLVQSDFTTAQNLNGSFTPILNLSMSQSSMTGASSWGLTGMIWLNFKQFALSGRYTKMQFNKKGQLKYIHNLSLTTVYSYGNLLAFAGYSGIYNMGKYGVTGFNASVASTLVAETKSTFFSPTITAFYTKPFKGNKRLTISPELYLISAPLIYSTRERVTTTDRTFSAFIGSGFDYQITKRFKFNMNDKANLSTNPEFPILSFFLIGSKINL